MGRKNEKNPKKRAKFSENFSGCPFGPCHENTSTFVKITLQNLSIIHITFYSRNAPLALFLAYWHLFENVHFFIIITLKKIQSEPF